MTPRSLHTRTIFLYTALVLTVAAALHAATSNAAAQPGEPPYFPDATYDSAVPTPDALLGFSVGARPATSDQTRACFDRWAATASTKFALRDFGRTHEGRPLYYAIITSETNLERFDGIQAAAARLADPRELNEAEAQRLIESTPGIVWLGFGIHGDEISSTDAALSLAHHLAAGTDAATRALRDELVILIDPNMNPDGRERFLKQIEQNRGAVENLDVQAIQHAGHWPWGRGNHYLFDMNRDWLPATQPETRARQAAIAAWHPHVLVDSHEMGPLDTYAFYPAREPFHPQVHEMVKKWWPQFAGDQGRAFDRFGWSYYTREWMDMWYPGYTDSWAILHGAVGLLYEQAGVDGSGVRQRAGTVLTYRESVHHHVVSAMATIETHRANRKQIAADYVENKRRAVDASRPENRRVLLLDPARHPSRVRALLDNLHAQGVDIGVARGEFDARRVADRFGRTWESRKFPAGTVAIAMLQPLGPLASAMLEFDPRMSETFLREERKELEHRRASKMYDISAWSLPMAYDLDGCWAESCNLPALAAYQPAPPPRGAVENRDAAFGVVLDGSDDAALRAVVRLVQRGVKVRVATKPFAAAGREFARGGFLIRRQDNPGELLATLEAVAADTGVVFIGADTGRSVDDGPDLGADRFALIERPRVAVLAASPVAPTSYGAIWHLLDSELGLDMSGLDAARFGRTDLRRYNVLLVPDGGLEAILKSAAGPLRDWVAQGGTLIAVADSAAALTEASLKLSAVRLRRDVLEKLDEYAEMVRLERSAGGSPIDVEGLYGSPAAEGGPTTAPGAGDSASQPRSAAAATMSATATSRAAQQEPASLPQQAESSGGVEAKPARPSGSAEQLKRRDEWARMFSPRGVLLRAGVDTEHWLTLGCGEELAVFVEGSRALMSMHPVATPVRLAPRERLRLSGLLWPEAAERLADTAYVTVESMGRGQVILFASDPAWRGLFRGPSRLLTNAVLLGPGLGASPVLPW